MSTHGKTIIILSGDTRGPNIFGSPSGIMLSTLDLSSSGRFKNWDEMDDWTVQMYIVYGL